MVSDWGSDVCSSDLVIKLLYEQAEVYEQRLGAPIVVRKVLVRDTSIDRGTALPFDRFTDNANDLFNDPSISIIVEVAGGDRKSVV